MNPAFMRQRRSPAPRNKNSDPFWYRYRFSLFSGLFILVALMAPGSTFSGLGTLLPYMDKLVHGGMFFIFSLCVSVEYRKDKGRLPGLWFAVALLAAFALTTEALQLLASGRSFDLRDGLADLIGAFSARILTGIIYRTRGAKTNISPAFRTYEPGKARPLPPGSRAVPPRMPGVSQGGTMPPRPGTGRPGAPPPPATSAGRGSAPDSRPGAGSGVPYPPNDSPGGQQSPT